MCALPHTPPTKPPHHRGGFSTFPPGGSGSLSLTLIHSLMLSALPVVDGADDKMALAQFVRM